MVPIKVPPCLRGSGCHTSYKAHGGLLSCWQGVQRQVVHSLCERIQRLDSLSLSLSLFFPGA